MLFGRFPLPPARQRQVILSLALAATLTLASCGGGSSDKTPATSASQSQATTAAGASTAMPAVSTTADATTAAATTEPTSAAPSDAGSTVADSGESDANSEAMQQIADAWAKQTAYKVTLNVYDTDATTPSFVSITETEPDKEHTLTTVAGQSIESITIGQDTWAKVAGSWQKSDGLELGEGAPVSGSDVIDELTETDPAFDVKISKKDDETLDGTAVNVYEVTDITGTVITMWAGKDDHLPRKSEIKTDTGRIEVIYSDYGTDFGIKAPV